MDRASFKQLSSNHTVRIAMFVGSIVHYLSDLFPLLSSRSTNRQSRLPRSQANFEPCNHPDALSYFSGSELAEADSVEMTAEGSLLSLKDHHAEQLLPRQTTDGSHCSQSSSQFLILPFPGGPYSICRLTWQTVLLGDKNVPV
jgi:hypothetical protein